MELHTKLKYLPAVDPAAIIAGNATKTGNTIDRQGFKDLEFLVISGVITDSTFTTTVYEGDASNMSDEAAVADADLIPETGAETGVLVEAADDSKVQKIGYRGSKRYVRIKIVQSGATTGGFVCAVAVQGNPDHVPSGGIA